MGFNIMISYIFLLKTMTYNIKKKICLMLNWSGANQCSIQTAQFYRLANIVGHQTRWTLNAICAKHNWQCCMLKTYVSSANFIGIVCLHFASASLFELDTLQCLMLFLLCIFRNLHIWQGKFINYLLNLTVKTMMLLMISFFCIFSRFYNVLSRTQIAFKRVIAQ